MLMMPKQVNDQGQKWKKLEKRDSITPLSSFFMVNIKL